MDLEVNTYAKLNLTRATDLVGDLSEVAGSRRCRWRSKLHTVEEVEKLGAEFKIRRLSDGR